jgi:hypothetical protein
MTMTAPNTSSVVQTASSEFYVGADGLMRARSADVITKAGEATTANASNSVLAVGTATVTAPISSELPDDAFFSLQTVKVESPTGAVMHLNVLGFVRHAPTTPGFPGAMEIVTHVGRVVLHGARISYTDDMQAALFAAHGFVAAAGNASRSATTVTGRARELQIRALFGIFNAVIDAKHLRPGAIDAATAARVLPPTLPEAFVMFARRRSPCVPNPAREGAAALATPDYAGAGPLPAGPGVDVCAALRIPDSELIVVPLGAGEAPLRFVAMTVTIYRIGADLLRTEYTHPLLPNQTFVEVLDTTDPENPVQFEYQVAGKVRARREGEPRGEPRSEPRSEPRGERFQGGAG